MKTKLHFSPFPTKRVSKTFFHSVLMTGVVLLLALGWAKLLPSSSSSARQNIHKGGWRSCTSCATPTNQIIYLPLSYLPEAQGSEIVFNSRATQEMDVTPTFYKLDGTAIVGKPERIQSTEIRYVDLKKLIPGPYRNDRDWGGMSLAYTGAAREMWAQLRLLGVNGGSNVDEFFSVPQEVRSDLQEAVWWAPQQSTTIIALGNITDTATGAIMRFGDGQEQTVSLAPHATQIIRRAPVSQAGGESVTISITGAAGSVIPTGVIASADGTFNSVVRFYETKMAKQPHLFGTGLRLAGTTPRMALKNTSSAPITATPKFIPLGGVDAGEPVTLPALALAPQQTAEVDLNPLMGAAKRRRDLSTVSVQVTNNGAPGSLIGALYSSDKTAGVNYDVPLRDSGPVRNMTGVYPWKISDDYTTIVYITNISDGPAEFVAQIHYDNGGKYVVGVRKLAAGETAVFDMKQVIDEQKPDYGKRLLPKNLQLGQFKWLVHGVTGGKIILTGRAEMVSLSQRISTSYSCAGPCMVGIGGWIDMESSITVGQTYTASAWEETFDANGFITGPYPAGGTWGSSNTSVFTVDGGGICTGVASGQAFLGFTSNPQEVFTWDGLECIDVGPQFWEDGGEMTVFCPLCTACGSPGMACAGNGQCKTGRDLIPEICDQLGITYEHLRSPGCSVGDCGVDIIYDITRVTHSCDSVSLGGANLTETVTTDNGCGPGPVAPGPGCPISSDNTLSCTDHYSICGPPSNFPSGTCTEIFTQNLFVGTCLAETRAITFTITKTPTSCSGTVTRD